MNETKTKYVNNDTLLYSTTHPTFWTTMENISTQILTSSADGLLAINSTFPSSRLTPLDGVTQSNYYSTENALNTATPTLNPTGIIEAEGNFNNNGTDSNSTSFTRYFCPAFYDFEQCTALNDETDPLYMCEKSGQAILFGVFVVSIGIVAIFGNAIMPIVVWRRRSMRTKQNYIKG